MEKKSRNNKNALKDRLSSITLIYLDGLGNKKKALLDKYLDKKITSVIDYYFNLLKRKKRKRFFLPPLVNEVQLTDQPNNENSSSSNVEAAEQNLNLQTHNIDKTSELNLNQHENGIK